jgi:hypothetical protein
MKPDHGICRAMRGKVLVGASPKDRDLNIHLGLKILFSQRTLPLLCLRPEALIYTAVHDSIPKYPRRPSPYSQSVWNMNVAWTVKSRKYLVLCICNTMASHLLMLCNALKCLHDRFRIMATKHTVLCCRIPFFPGRCTHVTIRNTKIKSIHYPLSHSTESTPCPVINSWCLVRLMLVSDKVAWSHLLPENTPVKRECSGGWQVLYILAFWAIKQHSEWEDRGERSSCWVSDVGLSKEQRLGTTRGEEINVRRSIGWCVVASGFLTICEALKLGLQETTQCRCWGCRVGRCQDQVPSTRCSRILCHKPDDQWALR